MATRGTILLTVDLAGALPASAGCVDTDRPRRRSPDSGAAPSPTLNQAREDLLQALRRMQGATHRYTVRGHAPRGADGAGVGRVRRQGAAVRGEDQDHGRE